MKANQFGTLSETPKAIEMEHRASDTAVDSAVETQEGHQVLAVHSACSEARRFTHAVWIVVLASALLCANAGLRSGAASARWKPEIGTPQWWDTDGRGVNPSRIILLYNSGSMPAWTSNRLRYYIAHIKPDGAPDAWFFNTVLILALTAESQRGFEPNHGNGPATAEDWRHYLDQRLFGGLSELAELEKAVQETGRQLGDRRRTVRVVIGIPYPDPRATAFGRLDDQPLDLSREEDRAAAVRWYVRQVSRRWTAGHFERLRLAGFYWVREEVPDQDQALLKQASRLVANQLLPFYWIPYFGSEGSNRWRELGFDIAIQQPNYFFYEVPPERIEEAATFARQHFMGIEMEMDRRVISSEEKRARYRRYLEGGVETGYLHSGVLAWYDDTALLECGRSQETSIRKVYDDTYRFVTGQYRKDEARPMVLPGTQ